MQAEIREIYQRARPEARLLYDLGRDVYLGKEENWIIRWLLWHVFRYRDDRNKCLRRATALGEGRARSDTPQTSGSAPTQDAPMLESFEGHLTRQLVEGSEGSISGRTNTWYDPVRGVYRT